MSTNQSGCYEVKCSIDGSFYRVISSNGNYRMEFKCDQAGLSFSPKKNGEEFICQDPSIICKNKTICQDDCNYRYFYTF